MVASPLTPPCRPSLSLTALLLMSSSPSFSRRALLRRRRHAACPLRASLFVLAAAFIASPLLATSAAASSPLFCFFCRAGGRVLPWKERLRIAFEAAQGLEYLHKGCKPAIVHRDVKTSNILLTSSLEAKIADFGLSKTFDSDSLTHMTTKCIGTPGYVDPEYYVESKLTEKSDVYSFGIVLLELITGLPAIVKEAGGMNTHIIQWVNQRLQRGDISEIVDPRLLGEYGVNSAWKAAEVALTCAAPSSARRPSVSELLPLLSDCLELEAVACEKQEKRPVLHSSTDGISEVQISPGLSEDVVPELCPR